MRLVLMQVGDTKTRPVRDLVDDYLGRLAHYMPVDVVTVPDVKGRSLTPDRQKALEGDALLSRLQAGDRVVLLDERGEMPASRQWAAEMQRQANSSLRRLVYVIGGPWGFSQAVYDRADAMLSLSRLTFPHELARLLLAEQLYRACTILRGESYHHE